MGKQKTSSDKSQVENKTQVLNSKDFVDSNPKLTHKGRITYVLERKYPKQVKSVSEWEEILIKEELIDPIETPVEKTTTVTEEDKETK